MIRKMSLNRVPGTQQRIKELNPATYWIWLILIIAAALRIYHYSAFSFSNDELSAINRLRFNTFHELVKGGFYVDGHPGGIQVFLWYWTGWFGTSEFAVRLPFVLFGILAVYFSYLVAKRLFGQVSGLFTAAALAFLEFPLLYSQIARPYGSGLFFCLLMVYFWTRIVMDSREKKLNWNEQWFSLAGYTLSTALCLYNHYFSFLFALIVGISGIFLLRKQVLIAYIVSGLVAALLFLPHLPITLNHLAYKGVGLWLGKPGWDWIPHHITYIFNDSVFLLVVTAATSFLLSWKGRRVGSFPAAPWLAVCWFLLPMIIGFLYSVYVNPVLQHSVLIFSFPFLIMMLFLGAGDEFGKFQKYLLAFFLLSGVCSTVVIDQYYKKQHFGEFRGIAETTMKWNKEYQSDSITKVVVSNSAWYLDFYFQQHGDSTKYAITDLRNDKDLDSLGELVKSSTKPYFLYAWTRPAPEGVEDIIRSKFPYVLRSYHYGTLSAITLFSRKPGTTFEPQMELVLLDSARIRYPSSEKQIKSESNDLEKCMRVDSAMEFVGGISIETNKYEHEGTLLFEINARINPFSIPSGALLVVSLEEPDGKSLRWESSKADRVAEAGNWCSLVHTMFIPGYECKDRKLKIYLWNKEHRLLRISELSYKLYRVNSHSPFTKDEIGWGSD